MAASSSPVPVEPSRKMPLFWIWWMSTIVAILTFRVDATSSLSSSALDTPSTTLTTTSISSPPPPPPPPTLPANTPTPPAPVSDSVLISDRRPQIVREALARNQSLYYFGLGSNMSRKKLENRGINGTKIAIRSMEAAFVRHHRLAFNMRGFPPLEPGMGSLEPLEVVDEVDDTSNCSGGMGDGSPLLSYHSPECHGALVLLTAENYEKVMRSEGVGGDTSDSNNNSNDDDNKNNNNRKDFWRWRQSRRHQQKQQQQEGYEEIVVEAYPYRNPDKPVQAIALRARKNVRLPFDPCPSARYMNILKEGAQELGLKPCYQAFLEAHPVQKVPRWLKREALYNLICTFAISSTFKWRGLSRIQSRLLFWVYARPSDRPWRQITSEVLTSMILLPGAVIGFVLYHLLRLLGRMPPFITRFLSLLDPDFATEEPRQSEQKENHQGGR